MTGALTAERLRAVLSYDRETGLFFWKDRPRSHFKTSQGYGSWVTNCRGKEAGSDTNHGYRIISIDDEKYLGHRLAWLYETGEWPEAQIDHINGNGTDNRIANLRDVSHTDNLRNCKLSRNNKSGVLGVRFIAKYGTWRATIWSKAKVISLGSFPTKEAAVAARQQAERLHGYHPNHGRAA